MPAIVDLRGIEELEDARSFEFGGGAVARVEAAANRAGNAILVCFAYVYEKVALLGAAVEPFFKDFGDLRIMRPEASRTQENEVGGLVRRIVNTQLSLSAVKR
jgi:hypothetical protein